MKRSKREIPDWIKFKIPSGERYSEFKRICKDRHINTICIEARCPNIGECCCSGSAAFLILGRVCTRNCLYCSVENGVPGQVDTEEPLRIAEMVHAMELDYVVVTSVTRDDLNDGGAVVFAETVKNIRDFNSGCSVELLMPDLRYCISDSLDIILDVKPDVIAHNIEVVQNLFSELRPGGSYSASLVILKRISSAGIVAKSGMMIGFGESLDDIKKTFNDLIDSGCRMITIGQYLQSRRDGYSVKRYYTPEEFMKIGDIAMSTGFERVMSGPMVRSSYRAKSMIL